MADDNDKIDKTQLTNFVLDKKSGKIFGFISIPEPFNSVIGTFIPRVLQSISEGGKPYIKKAVSNFASSSLKMQDAQAENIGRITAQAFAYAVPLLRNAMEFISTGKENSKNKKALNKLIAPVLHQGGGLSGIFGGGNAAGNKMIAHARGIVRSKTVRSLGLNTASLAPSALSLYTSRLDDTIQNLKSGVTGEGKSGDSSNEDVLGRLEKTHAGLKDYGMVLAGGFDEGVKKMGSLPDPLEVITQNTSLGTILDLKEFMRKSGVDCKKLNDSTIEDINKRVIKAFQQFQQEQGRGAIPSHSMSEVAELITQHLVHGDLHPLSLINIIGKEELLDKTKLSFKPPEEIQEVLVKETMAERLNRELEEEMKMVISNPQLAGFFGSYSLSVKRKLESLAEEIKRLNEAIEEKRTAIAEEFGEQKKYEIAQENLRKQIAEEEKHRAQKRFDEVATQQYMNKHSEG